MSKTSHQSPNRLVLGVSLAIAVTAFLIGIFAYRQNNLTAIDLRDEVLKVDEEGGDVTESLNTLREYTFSHMNASLVSTTQQQPIQLVYTYERLQKQEQDRITKANENVYNEAQKSCEARFPGSFSGGPRVPCIEEYVEENSVEARSIQEDLYKFGFVSPIWSPDLAGWSLLISAVFGLFFVLRLAYISVLNSYDN